MLNNDCLFRWPWLIKFRRFVHSCALLVAVQSICAQSTTPGALDSAFAPVIGTSLPAVYALCVQPDGKILIGGDFTRVNVTTCKYLARLNTDGALDSAFGTVSGADNPVHALALQTDGRIVVGGDFWSLNGASWRGLARLQANGVPDTSFGNFSGANGRVNAVCVQSDGKILIGGSFSQVDGTPHPYIARLNVDGSLDNSFTAVVDGTVYTLALRSNGSVLAGGDFAHANNSQAQYLAQFNSLGALDSSFTPNVDYTVYSIALQTNGQVLIGGGFGKVDGSWHYYIARLNLDGRLDNTFTTTTSGYVYALAVLPDGKVMVGGRFSNVNGTTRNNLARLNGNGLLDGSFDSGTGPDYTVRTVQAQQDGKIVIGGEFGTVSMVARPALARLFGDLQSPPPAQEFAVQVSLAVEIGFPSQTNALYQVQWSYEASPTIWNNLGQPVPGNGTTSWVFDSTRNSARKFYRAVKLP